MSNPKTNEAVNTQLVESLLQVIRSLSSAEQALLEEKLFNDIPYPSTLELIHLSEKGGAFDELYNEADIYTLEDGEPL